MAKKTEVWKFKATYDAPNHMLEIARDDVNLISNFQAQAAWITEVPSCHQFLWLNTSEAFLKSGIKSHFLHLLAICICSF